MAAVYLHNAIHSRNPSEPSDILEHSRNISTISSATLLTNTTLHSQPTEPLLNTLPPGAAAASYFGQSRQSDDSPTHLRWDDRLALDTDPKTVGEKARWRGSLGRNAFRGRQRVKFIWETVIAAWAAFNTIRYFMGFPLYDKYASAGQSLSLALGTSTGIAVALFLCSQVIALVKHKVRAQAHAFKYLTHIRHSLHFLSSICIFGPAVVSFVLTFVWRHSSNSRYDIQRRCHIDIDVVWSATHNLCINQSSPLGVWLALSALRVVLTLIVLVAYHSFSLVYPDTPQRPLHHRLRSDSYVSSPLTPIGGPSSTAMMLPRNVNHDLRPQHQISDSTLAESCRPPSRLGRARSYSSGISGEANSGEIPHSPGRSCLPESEDEREDRHRSLLAQIAQETDDALEYALGSGSRENPPSPPPPSPGLPPSYSRNDHDHDYDSDDDQYNEQFQGRNDNTFNLPSIPPVLGYNEFGLPYPPDQPVRMLNGFVRRMPTIESMGSGEVGSIGASSIHIGNGSLYTSSRPPTRNTLLSFCSTDYEISPSRPSSRPNSLSARAELLAGVSNVTSNACATTSEHGELLGLSTKRVSASSTSYLEFPTPPIIGETRSSTNSQATSYHTATTGSGDSFPPLSPISMISKQSAEHSHER